MSKIKKLTKEVKYLTISVAISAVLISIGILSRDPGVLGNVWILSTFIVATPQLLFRYTKYRELKEMEQRFPTFLRDLTESISSGMPFHKSIQSASKTDYGKLSKEIKKMSNQISWGMTVDKVLNQFRDRVKRSKRLYTTIGILRESYLSGGNIISILESIADDVTMLEESDKERRSILNQYVILMYAVCIIFIVIAVAINRLLLPIFSSTPGAGLAGGPLSLTSPCDECTDVNCNICSLFEGTAQYVFSIEPKTIGAYYTSLFFFMSLIVAIFSGLVAGQIAENSVTAGIKHSLILVAITFGAFSILIRTGFMGI